MTKSETVANAVTAELTAEKRPVDDLSKVMKADLLYEAQPLDIYLQKVKGRLATSRYTFNYPNTFVAQALGWSIAQLIDEINDLTT